MSKLPRTIFLQHQNANNEELEITWLDERIFKYDVEYVRKDALLRELTSYDVIDFIIGYCTQYELHEDRVKHISNHLINVIEDGITIVKPLGTDVYFAIDWLDVEIENYIGKSGLVTKDGKSVSIMQNDVRFVVSIDGGIGHVGNLKSTCRFLMNYQVGCKVMVDYYEN